MSSKISSEILLDFAAKDIWRILTDLEAYEQWNPFIISASGEIKEGERIKVAMTLGNGKVNRLSPKVGHVDHGKMFGWRGSLPIPGLFVAKHKFELFREGKKTRLIQSEVFSGLLVPFTKNILKKTEAQFANMHSALERRLAQGGV